MTTVSKGMAISSVRVKLWMFDNCYLACICACDRGREGEEVEGGREGEREGEGEYVRLFGCMTDLRGNLFACTTNRFLRKSSKHL